MQEVKTLRITNTVIYLLALVGAAILLYIGFTEGECVADCEEYYAEYQPSPTIIAYGFTALLMSSLLFQIVNLFAVHVEKSHS